MGLDPLVYLAAWQNQGNDDGVSGVVDNKNYSPRAHPASPGRWIAVYDKPRVMNWIFRYFAQLGSDAVSVRFP